MKTTMLERSQARLQPQLRLFAALHRANLDLLFLCLRYGCNRGWRYGANGLRARSSRNMASFDCEANATVIGSHGLSAHERRTCRAGCQPKATGLSSSTTERASRSHCRRTVVVPSRAPVSTASIRSGFCVTAYIFQCCVLSIEGMFGTHLRGLRHFDSSSNDPGSSGCVCARMILGLISAEARHHIPLGLRGNLIRPCVVIVMQSVVRMLYPLFWGDTAEVSDIASKCNHARLFRHEEFQIKPVVAALADGAL